jgi:diguanylate cyclase (GGDEF)-like protein
METDERATLHAGTAAIRAELVDRVLAGLVIVACVGAPASASRALSTGWSWLYTLHIALAILVLMGFLVRHKLPQDVKAGCILGLFLLIGGVGVLKLGLLGAGIWWLVMSSLLASTLYGSRVGMLISLTSLVLVVLAGVGFTTGLLRYNVDPAEYVTSATSWVSFVIAASLMPFIVFQAISMFQHSTSDLLVRVHRQQEEIERLATHDSLTGLPGRGLAEDRLRIALEMAERTGRKVAVMFVDLDRFKQVNDQLGHDAGDQVLRVAASRLQQSLREGDTASRIGGDEFMLILPVIHHVEDVADIAQRAVQSVSKPIVVESGEAMVGASIGIAIYPDDGNSLGQLRKSADVAMYRVKRSGCGGFARVEVQ